MPPLDDPSGKVENCVAICVLKLWTMPTTGLFGSLVRGLKCATCGGPDQSPLQDDLAENEIR